MKKFKLVTRIDRVNLFSDLFISYYTKIFSLDEFYFLINDRNFLEISNYLTGKGFKIDQFENVLQNEFGTGSSVIKQNEIQKKLINQGHIVIYVDIDEFLFSDNLKKTITQTNEELISPKGFCLIQYKDETFLDTNKNILDQRTKCYSDDVYYSKVCIVKKKYEWTGGRHNRVWYIQPNEKILLLDIGKVCKKLMIENNSITKKIYSYGVQRYGIDDIKNIEVEYEKYYNKNIVEIPDLIKKNKTIFI